MFDCTALHARALELLAAAPNEPTVQLNLVPEDFPAGFHVGVWINRFAVDLRSAMIEALADRPAVRKVEVVCPQMFRIPIGFEIPPPNN